MTLKLIEKIILYTVISANLIFSVLLLSGNMPLNGLTLTGALKSTAKHAHGRYDNSFITGVNYKFNPATMEFDALVEGSSLEASNLRCPSGSVSGAVFVNNGALYQYGSILFVEDNNFQKKKVYLTRKDEIELYKVLWHKLFPNEIIDKDFRGWYRKKLADGEKIYHRKIYADFKDSYIGLDWLNVDRGGLKRDKNGWYKEVNDPLAVGFVNCSGLLQITPDYKNNGVEIVGTFIDRDGVHKVSQEEVERIKKECKDEIRKELLDAPVVKKGKK